jgi:hypothetical protein
MSDVRPVNHAKLKKPTRQIANDFGLSKDRVENNIIKDCTIKMPAFLGAVIATVWLARNVK